METAVSKRNHAKKGNKENTRPANEAKSFIKRDKAYTAPFGLKNGEKEVESKNGPVKAKVKPTATRPASVKAPTKVNPVQRPTHTRAFVTEQAAKHKRMVAEAPKAAAPLPPSKSAPGMYKGKIVQSKIGSMWKSTTSVDKLGTKTESQRVGTVTKMRSKSVDLPYGATKKPAPKRPAQVPKSAVASRPPAGFYSARPTRTVPATLTSTSSRTRTAASTKGSGTLNTKTKVPVTDRKVNKPPVSSSISHYRLTTETAEERRAKLAEWLASKGKTLKRPAMATTTTVAAAAPSKNDVKPGAHLRSQSRAEALSAAQCNPDPGLEACRPDSPAAVCADTQGAALTTVTQSPVIIHTTLELLEESDDEPGRVEDIVVNLCDALEAMSTPSKCRDEEVAPVSEEESSDVTEDEKPEEESIKEEEVENETESEHEMESDEDDDEERSDGDDAIKTTSQMCDASVVKYSVKTTPYLQSVKKTIEEDVSTSRRKSDIKDLKFLTPVRRSTRIQRISSRLPAMLADHDPCVSSLAELVQMDDDPNAYIYRKNSALLENLPDQHRE